MFSFSTLSQTPDETHELGRRVSQLVAPGMLLGLSGELGVGKTEFVRGFVSGFGTGNDVTSPSYVLENVYTLANPRNEIEEIFHWDLYRLGEGASATELFEVRQHPSALAIVEWVNFSPELRNLLTLEILITSSGFQEDSSGSESDTQMREFEFQVRQDEAFFKKLRTELDKSAANEMTKLD